jgi:hypothetical protein
MRQNGVHILYPDKPVPTIVPEMADPQQQVHQTRRCVENAVLKMTGIMISEIQRT